MLYNHWKIAVFKLFTNANKPRQQGTQRLPAPRSTVTTIAISNGPPAAAPPADFPAHLKHAVSQSLHAYADGLHEIADAIAKREPIPIKSHERYGRQVMAASGQLYEAWTAMAEYLCGRRK